MRPAIAVMVAIIFSGLFAPKAAAHSVNAWVLLTAICEWESRGSRDPEDEISSAGAVGYCQIRVTTARWLGFRGKNWKLLIDRDVNIFWASKFLNKCLTRWHNTPYRIAFCYHGGLDRKVPASRAERIKTKSHHYAIAVARRYRFAMERRRVTREEKKVLTLRPIR